MSVFDIRQKGKRNCKNLYSLQAWGQGLKNVLKIGLEYYENKYENDEIKLNISFCKQILKKVLFLNKTRED